MSANFEFSSNDIPDDLIIETIKPQYYPNVEESIEFHAARLLLLIKYAGGRSGKISGRLRLAKLDFFVRYPTYLLKALGTETEIIPYLQPESPMIRYKYGPWDKKYYDVFAFLVAKGLVSISPTKSGDEFALTDRGHKAVIELEGRDFEEIINRCKLVYQRFKDFSGPQIKDYIYKTFPEIVSLPLSSEI
jgi:hypothetical protein